MPAVVVVAVARGGPAHVLAGRGLVRSARGREIHADPATGDHETVATIAGPTSVTHLVEIHEAKTATAS